MQGPLLSAGRRRANAPLLRPTPRARSAPLRHATRARAVPSRARVPAGFPAKRCGKRQKVRTCRPRVTQHRGARPTRPHASTARAAPGARRRAAAARERTQGRCERSHRARACQHAPPAGAPAGPRRCRASGALTPVLLPGRKHGAARVGAPRGRCACMRFTLRAARSALVCTQRRRACASRSLADALLPRARRVRCAQTTRRALRSAPRVRRETAPSTGAHRRSRCSRCSLTQRRFPRALQATAATAIAASWRLAPCFCR